jgi:hypothetical protein
MCCVNGRLYLSCFCRIVPEYSSATYCVQFTGTVMNLLLVPLVAMEGYYTKFTIFTGATTPTNNANMFAIDRLSN